MHDIEAAIRAASNSELDTIVQAMTAVWAKGEMDDETYSAAYGAAHRRRADLKVRAAAPRQGRLFPRKLAQRSPDRQRSLERRRTLAASGPLPPRLAARFTVGELAVLRIVGDECRDRGRCDRSLDEIAARAGVCRDLAKRTLRLAARHGLLRITERPRSGGRHDTNIVEVVSSEWAAWIARGRRSIGGKKLPTPDTKDKKGLEQEAWRGCESLARRDSREPLRGPPARESRRRLLE